MTEKAKDSSATATPAASGLRGVVIGASSVSDVVGDKGELIYQGYNIHDLAEHSTFEEVAFLLWNKRLPNQAELAELKKQLGASYALPQEILEFLSKVPREADPIDVLRTAVSALEFRRVLYRSRKTPKQRPQYVTRQSDLLWSFT